MHMSYETRRDLMSAFHPKRALRSTVAAHQCSNSNHGSNGSATNGGQASRKRCGAPLPLTSAGWQVTVEDVRSGFPLAADLPPDDHVLAGVGLRSAVGRNRKTIRPTIERHVTRR